MDKGSDTPPMAAMATALFYSKELAASNPQYFTKSQSPKQKLVVEPKKEKWALQILEDKNKNMKELYGDASFQVVSPNEMVKSNTMEALEFLKKEIPSFYSIYQECVSHCFVAESKDLWSVSIPQAMGTIVICPKKHWDINYYVEAIVHESTHVELSMKQQIDPLLKNPMKTTKNPLRKDPRPLNGTFHAAVVMLRTSYALKRLPKNKNNEVLLDEFLEKLPVSLEEIEANAIFTEKGKTFFEEMESFYQSEILNKRHLHTSL